MSAPMPASGASESAELHAPAYGPKDGSMTIGDGIDGRPYISDPIRERIAMAEPTYTRNPDGVDLIAQERRRQIEQEGWTREHDAQHEGDGLALAAAAYALPADLRDVAPRSVAFGTVRPVPGIWPWEGRSWKPSPDDRVRELVKAGALIAAEIDRLANGK